MTEDASFKIKGLETLLNENKEARSQVLHKHELYPFVMRLLNESDKGNELYPFLVRVLEENKELVRRLSDCQKSYGIMEIREVDNRRRTNELYAEREKLEAASSFLKKENEAMKTKIAKAAKRKSK